MYITHQVYLICELSKSLERSPSLGGWYSEGDLLPLICIYTEISMMTAEYRRKKSRKTGVGQEKKQEYIWYATTLPPLFSSPSLPGLSLFIP